MALSKKAAKRVAGFLKGTSILNAAALRGMLQGMGKAAGGNKSFQKTIKRICKFLTKASAKNVVRTKLAKKAS